MAESRCPGLSLVQTAVTAFSGTLDEDEIVRVLLEQAVVVAGAKAALLRLLARDNDTLELRGAVGLSQEYLEKGPVFGSQSEVDRRALAGERVSAREIGVGSSFPFAAAAATEGLRAAVVVPLTLRGRVLGLMRLFVDDLDALTDEQYLSLDVLAALGAFTIEKVRLHDSLVRLAESLNASLELGPMLQQVLQTTVDEMGFTAAAIRLLDREGQLLKLAAAVGLSEEYLAKGEVELARSAVDQRALAGEIVVRRAGEEAGWQYPEELARENIQMVLVVPLILRGVPKGVLRAYSARPRQFGPVAQQYLRSVAGMVALAVEKAELHAALQSRYEDLKLDLAEWYQFLALG